MAYNNHTTKISLKQNYKYLIFLKGFKRFIPRQEVTVMRRKCLKSYMLQANRKFAPLGIFTQTIIYVYFAVWEK